ncbi:hypothetical protein B0J17DRAFT_715253 [Rhizoctonia solani]|nr:hypothetical protein B0J17DRAFT_715253 [Rhizoctonia solani]
MACIDTASAPPTSQATIADIKGRSIGEEILREGPKRDVLFEELLKFQSGILVLSIMNGKIARNARLQVLLDDAHRPIFSTKKAHSTHAQWAHVGECFIKELDFELKANAKRFLEEALMGPTTFTLRSPDGKNNSTVRIQASYFPVRIGLDPNDVINSILRVELTDGRELRAADHNGKADPFAIFTLNGSRVFKSRRRRQT